MKLPTKYTKLNASARRDAKDQYMFIQNGNCMYCGESLHKDPPKRILSKKIDWSLFPNNFLEYPIHLQHNHDTDLTEGIVHAYCNAVMWQYENR